METKPFHKRFEVRDWPAVEIVAAGPLTFTLYERAVATVIYRRGRRPVLAYGAPSAFDFLITIPHADMFRLGGATAFECPGLPLGEIYFAVTRPGADPDFTPESELALARHILSRVTPEVAALLAVAKLTGLTYPEPDF